MYQRNDGPPIGGMVFNAFPVIGVLRDFFPHSEPRNEHEQHRWERKVQASAGRWVSLVVTALIALGFAFGTHGALAMLVVVVVWLPLVNRFVWQEGFNPSPAAAVAATRLGFLMLASASLATLAWVLSLLFPWPVFTTVAMVATAVATLLALADALLTARAIRDAQVPPEPDLTPFAIVQGIFGISDLALGKYMESGSLEANIAGGVLTAKIPVGPDSLLEDRRALDERVALKARDWQVEFADAATDELILGPVDEATRAQRDAVARSGGLFAEALGTGLDDLEVIDLSMADEPLPRLS